MGCCFSDPLVEPVPAGTAYAVRCEPIYQVPQGYGQQVILQGQQQAISYYPYQPEQISYEKPVTYTQPLPYTQPFPYMQPVAYTQSLPYQQPVAYTQPMPQYQYQGQGNI